jgi:hypothetical protein
MARAIEASPYVIQLLGQWKAYPSFFTPNNRYVDNDAMQVEEHTPIATAPEDFKAGPMECAVSVPILLLVELHGTNAPEPPWFLRYLLH